MTASGTTRANQQRVQPTVDARVADGMQLLSCYKTNLQSIVDGWQDILSRNLSKAGQLKPFNDRFVRHAAAANAEFAKMDALYSSYQAGNLNANALTAKEIAITQAADKEVLAMLDIWKSKELQALIQGDPGMATAQQNTEALTKKLAQKPTAGTRGDKSMANATANKASSLPTMADRVIALATPNNVGGGIGLLAGIYGGWEFGKTIVGEISFNGIWDSLYSLVIKTPICIGTTVCGCIAGRWAGEKLQQPVVDAGTWVGDQFTSNPAPVKKAAALSRTDTSIAQALLDRGEFPGVGNRMPFQNSTSQLVGVVSLTPRFETPHTLDARGGIGA